MTAAVTACSGPDATAQPPSTSESATGPVVTATTPAQGLSAAPTLGLKWNWAQQATLDFVRSEPGGPSFFEVEWCEMEHTRGQISWTRVDSIVQRTRSLGHDLMLKIRVGAGCWGAQGGAAAIRDPLENTRKTPSEFPTDPAGYEAFVTAFVEHYTALGVDTYAIENEVDANNFWSGTPQEYVDLVALGARAVRRANPGATVLDAGISSTGYGVAMAKSLIDAGKDEDALQLYQQYYARRVAGDASRFPAVDDVEQLRGLLDDARARRVLAMVEANWQAVNAGDVTAYQLHFYENPALAPVLLDYIRERIPAGMPIQGWEVGLAWPGADFTLTKQAADVARLLATLYARGVSPLVYLPLAFTPGANKQEVFRGLIEPDGSALPAAAVFQRFADAAKQAQAVAPVRADGFDGAAFLGSSVSTVVLWRQAGSSALTAPPGGELLDLSGKPLPTGHAVTVTPVFLTVPESSPASVAAALSAAVGVSVSVG